MLCWRLRGPASKTPHTPGSSQLQKLLTRLAQVRQQLDVSLRNRQGPEVQGGEPPVHTELR
eukprot:1292131-Lingulodinium_polyedra.AAC.1